MKEIKQNNSNYLDWLTSLSGQGMNSSAILKTVRLVREIKKRTGAPITLSDNGFILDLVRNSEIIQSKKIDSMLHELIEYLLNSYNSEQQVDTAGELSEVDINVVLQQLSLRSKVIDAVMRAKSKPKPDLAALKVPENLNSLCKKTILIVDDDIDLLPLISDYLSRLGYETLVASGGHEALAIIAKGTRPDLLLTDIKMPFINGFNLASKVKEIHPEIGVIYMSAHQEYASGEYRSGVDVDGTLLQKPFSIPVLFNALNDVSLSA